jgi:protein-L-isoaspartate O-methyltransferase
MNGTDAVRMREKRFWDENVRSLDECISEYEAGPDPNAALMLDALEPLAGTRVLDFACGVGITSAWLSDRGATVTGVDLSPKAVKRAEELARALGSNARFVVGDLGRAEPQLPIFDRILGRFALHHVDCATVAPVLAHHLVPGGVAAFLETMDANPVLRLARRYLVGRLGIPRYGTRDEHPLTHEDLEVLRNAFGGLRLDVAQLQFFRIFDRQVLQFRSPAASKLLGAIDDFLLRTVGWRSGSYHQVVVLERSAA